MHFSHAARTFALFDIGIELLSIRIHPQILKSGSIGRNCRTGQELPLHVGRILNPSANIGRIKNPSYVP